MGVTRWKRCKRAVRAAVVRGLIRVVSRLRLPAALSLGGYIGRIAWKLSPGLRRDMRAGLATAFPERSAAERDAIARECLVHLGWVGGEMVSLVGHSRAIEQYVEVAPDALATLARLRRSGVGI